MGIQTGTITTSTSAVTYVNIIDDTTAMVSVSGTYSGVTVNFEVSNDGGITFYSVYATRMDSGATEDSRVLADNTSQLWAVQIAGMTTFRVRASAHTGGTANVMITTGDWPLPLAGSGSTGNVNVIDPLPTGDNVIGSVEISGSLPAGSAALGSVIVSSLPTVADKAQTAVSILNQASAAKTSSNVTANLSAAGCRHLSIGIDITVVSGTNPTAVFSLEYLGADGIWYTVWTSVKQYAVGRLVASIGPGTEFNHIFSDTVRLRWTLAGGGPSFTFSASIVGK